MKYIKYTYIHKKELPSEISLDFKLKSKNEDIFFGVADNDYILLDGMTELTKEEYELAKEQEFTDYLNQVKIKKLKILKSIFNKKLSKLTLEFTPKIIVNSDSQSLKNFEIGLELKNYNIRDVNNDYHIITATQMKALVKQIKVNIMDFYKKK
jgi:hypothetical protein